MNRGWALQRVRLISAYAHCVRWCCRSVRVLRQHQQRQRAGGPEHAVVAAQWSLITIHAVLNRSGVT
jgi:hypothetical protein